MEILNDYLSNKNKLDYSFGEFSLLMLHNGLGYSYIDSIILLDEYIKNPNYGKANILKRKDK